MTTSQPLCRQTNGGKCCRGHGLAGSSLAQRAAPKKDRSSLTVSSFFSSLEKLLGIGVAVIAGDYQSPALAKPIYQLPKAIGTEFAFRLCGNNRRAVLLILVQVNQWLVGPLVPYKQPWAGGNGTDTIGKRGVEQSVYTSGPAKTNVPGA